MGKEKIDMLRKLAKNANRVTESAETNEVSLIQTFILETIKTKGEKCIYTRTTTLKFKNKLLIETNVGSVWADRLTKDKNDVIRIEGLFMEHPSAPFSTNLLFCDLENHRRVFKQLCRQ